nr:hypothetical protein [Tanacetum cinerariifolium]
MVAAGEVGSRAVEMARKWWCGGDVEGGDDGGFSMGGYGGSSEGDRVVVVSCRGGVAAGGDGSGVVIKV